MKFKKKEGGAVLFSAAKSTEIRRNMRDGVARAVLPRIRAIDRWLERDSARLDEFVL